MMAEIHKGKMTVEIEGDFVVFLIGMRINKPWKLHKWLPVALAMPRMIKELYANPDLGFLGHTGGSGVMVQYWRSFDHLEAYARCQDHAHLPAWVDFHKRVRASSGDVGIWHETFLVREGEYEAFYGAMPPFGLGKVGTLIPATGHRKTARERLNREKDQATEGKKIKELAY